MAKPAAGGPPIDAAALNRATLARQLLLERQAMPVVAAVERLAGLQAQLARPPFVGLWTRLDGFRREDLIQALHDREVVRVTAMRVTLHLLSARDYQRLRGSLVPVLDGAMAAITKAIAKSRGGTLPDLDALVAAARAVLADGPLTFEGVRQQLVTRFPGEDERAMGYAVRTQLPLVQVPSGDAWGFAGAAPFTPAATWLGQEPDREDRAAELVRRYLAAFGPASVADCQVWSGRGGLKAAFEAQRGELVTFRDARGRELFDLPDAPRPDAATPAPVRYLPEFDNLVLAHDDRARLIDDAHRKRVTTPNLQVKATFLVDGRVAGTWAVKATKTKAVLTLTPFGALAKADRQALEAEGARLLAFVEPGVKATDFLVEDA